VHFDLCIRSICVELRWLFYGEDANFAHLFAMADYSQPISKSGYVILGNWRLVVEYFD
jgi:hypothetical protein